MKATRIQPEPAFIPVTLTLETQHEVDAIFAVLNHATLSDLLGLEDRWRILSPMSSPEYGPLLNKITMALRGQKV